MAFSDFRQINYGVTGKDLNICDEGAFTYKIKGDYKPDLTKSSETFLLENNGTTKLPDLNITLSVVNSNTLNVKWRFQETPKGYRQQFEVPKDIINVTAQKTTAQLERFLDIQNTPNKPFGIRIQNLQGSYVLSITEMLLDQNLNIITAIHNTTSGDNFKGIFGLGERVQGDDLFY